MSATFESPVPWRKAAERCFVGNGLFRSRSTQSDLAAKASARGCSSDVLSSVGVGRFGPPTSVWAEGTRARDLTVNGVGCSPSSSPRVRRRTGVVSSRLNTFCHQLQLNVTNLAIPGCLRSERSRLLSQSSEALTSCIQVQTAPVNLLSKPLTESKRAPEVPQTCSFSAPVNGATATVVVGKGVQVDEGGSSKRTAIPTVRCVLVAGLVNECSVVDHLLVIDCRSFVAYNSNHVRGALNISCADCISRKRLVTGRITVGDLVSGAEDAKDRYQRAAEAVRAGNKTAVQVIVYDEDTVNFDDLPANSPLRLVVSCLLKDGFDVYYMFGKPPSLLVVVELRTSSKVIN